MFSLNKNWHPYTKTANNTKIIFIFIQSVAGKSYMKTYMYMTVIS